MTQAAAVPHPALASHTRRLRGLRVLVGNTPLLAIECEFRGRRRVIHAKAEYLNLSGSIKDRMALHIMRRAYDTGELAPAGAIIEATSGNTGISFAAIGRALGHPVIIFMPDWMSEERKRLIRSFGAEVRLVSSADGGFLESIARAEELAATTAGGFLPRQFANQENARAHELTTGPEIWQQLRWHHLTPDAFVAGVGTGGTIMGVGALLRRMHPEVLLHPVEPANSPTLSRGVKSGAHRIQGISDEFVPPIVQLDALDEVIAVDDGDAIRMAQKLASELGLGVGISSGANFLAALEVQERLGADATVVTVFADDNKKYLTTDLVREERARPDHVASHVRLLAFSGFNRVCSVCVDPGAPETLPAGWKG